MEVSGLNEWTADLAAAAASIDTKAKAAIDKTKRQIKDTAVEIVAVDDGELRDSIEETEDGVVATARHAPFVEDGTYKDAPQPFMDPAVDQHVPDFLTVLEDACEDI